MRITCYKSSFVMPLSILLKVTPVHFACGTFDVSLGTPQYEECRTEPALSNEREQEEADV